VIKTLNLHTQQNIQ